MCCKRKGLTITGMSIRADICQILGLDSQNSLVKEKPPKGYMWCGKEKVTLLKDNPPKGHMCGLG